MGLDDPTKKMSKSAPSPNNYIAMLDTPDEIRHKIKIAVTDSGKDIKYDETAKPALSNLLSIYSAFSGLTRDAIEKRFQGKGYADFKKDLGELLVDKLSPIQKKFSTLVKNQDKLLNILKTGAKDASIAADKTLALVKKRMGFVT